MNIDVVAYERHQPLEVVCLGERDVRCSRASGNTRSGRHCNRCGLTHRAGANCRKSVSDRGRTKARGSRSRRRSVEPATGRATHHEVSARVQRALTAGCDGRRQIGCISERNVRAGCRHGAGEVIGGARQRDRARARINRGCAADCQIAGLRYGAGDSGVQIAT